MIQIAKNHRNKIKFPLTLKISLIIFSLLLFITLINYWGISNLTKNNLIATKIDEILINVNNIRINVFDHFAQNNNNIMKEVEGKITLSKKKLEMDLVLLEKYLKDEKIETQNKLFNLKNLWKIYDENMVKNIEKSGNFGKEDALTNEGTEGSKKYTELKVNLENLLTVYSVSSEVQMKEKIIKLLAISFAFGAIYAFFFFVFANIVIVRPIKSIVAAAQEMGAGKYETRVNLNQKDEIGHLGGHFNSMAVSIQKNVEVIAEQNANLEKKVEERTKEVLQKSKEMRALFDSIPIGVFCIENNLTIGKEFSPVTPNIVGVKDLQGKTFKEILLKNASLGVDIKNQITTALSFCLGHQAINFELNSDTLPTELSLSSDDEKLKKILELTWNAIENDKHVIEKVLVCIRDVTKLRELAMEASKQRKLAESYSKVLNMTSENASSYFGESQSVINNLEKMAKKQDLFDDEEVKSFKRDLHTVKGISRIHQFAELTDAIHEFETTIAKAEEEKRGNFWIAGNLISDLEKIKNIFLQYKEIAQKTGKLTGNNGQGINSLMSDPFAQDFIQKLKDFSEKDMLIKSFLPYFTSILGRSLIDILNPLEKSLKSLASELGKETPKLEIKGHNVVIKKEFQSLMENIFTHIFRNSLDHGIELAKERLEKNKPSSGKLTLEMTEKDSFLEIRYYDDGRGLNISKLKSKGVENNLITETENDISKIANLIFHSGLSTAEKVTDISGRGVGMDAVREYIRSAGGDVEIQIDKHLKDNYSIDNGYSPFNLVLKISREICVSSR